MWLKKIRWLIDCLCYFCGLQLTLASCFNILAGNFFFAFLIFLFFCMAQSQIPTSVLMSQILSIASFLQAATFILFCIISMDNVPHWLNKIFSIAKLEMRITYLQSSSRPEILQKVLYLAFSIQKFDQTFLLTKFFF